MRNEAPIIQLDAWAARTNAETRRLAGSVAPEECIEARAYLDELMTDREAAACRASDLERVWALCAPDEEDDHGWPRELWAQAAREYHKSRGNRVSIAWAEPREAVGAARSTLRTAEFLVQQKDPLLMRRWLGRHSAVERETILQHLEEKKEGGRNG